VAKIKDYGTDSLLALNGDRYFVDDRGDLEAVFKISCVSITPERPHGLNYSLVLLTAQGKRVVCFDNAHAVSQGSGPGKKNSKQYDHKHIGNKVTPYEFRDAYTLVADFWDDVDKLI
jgi:hypothetical protein